jgi:hypothetical protein
VGILTALFFIEADYIATVLYPNFLDFKGCRISRNGIESTFSGT